MGTPRSMVAEVSSSIAVESSANGAPVNLISAPAAPGPATSAAELASAFLACASTKRSRGTICVSTICAALPAVVLTTPITKGDHIQPGHGQPSEPPGHRHGRHAECDGQLADDIDGQFSHPVQPDAGGQGEQHERNDSIAVKNPICVGEACISTAAVSGMANSVTWPPKEEISIDVQSLR
jgi:hypothetical protein